MKVKLPNQSENIQVNVSSLDAGLYILKVRTKTRVEIVKFIKN